MTRWFRFYDDAINDPKVLKLSDKLHRVWIGLLCVASKNDGELPSLEDTALLMRMKADKLEVAIKCLILAGLIDDNEAILSPHNWDARQFKSDVSTERVKRFRERPRNVSSDVSETPPETEQNRAEKKDAAKAAPDDQLPLPPVSGPTDPEKELFRRGKEVCGPAAGGLIAKLKKAKGGNIALARAAVETASTRHDPREYLGAIIAGGHPSEDGRRLTNDEKYYGVGREPGII